MKFLVDWQCLPSKGFLPFASPYPPSVYDTIPQKMFIWTQKAVQRPGTKAMHSGIRNKRRLQHNVSVVSLHVFCPRVRRYSADNPRLLGMMLWAFCCCNTHIPYPYSVHFCATGHDGLFHLAVRRSSSSKTRIKHSRPSKTDCHAIFLPRTTYSPRDPMSTLLYLDYARKCLHIQANLTAEHCSEQIALTTCLSSDHNRTNTSLFHHSLFFYILDSTLFRFHHHSYDTIYVSLDRSREKHVNSY